MSKASNGRILSRILKPVASILNEETARKLLSVKADRAAQARVDELADKCTEGELSPEERREYELYLAADHLVAILTAKARILLARKGQTA